MPERNRFRGDVIDEGVEAGLKAIMAVFDKHGPVTKGEVLAVGNLICETLRNRAIMSSFPPGLEILSVLVDR